MAKGYDAHIRISHKLWDQIKELKDPSESASEFVRCAIEEYVHTLRLRKVRHEQTERTVSNQMASGNNR